MRTKLPSLWGTCEIGSQVGVPARGAVGTYNSVGSTESVYLTSLDNTVKRDLFCSLSLPNRISLSSSTNAKMSGKDPLTAAVGVNRTLFFLAEHAGQRCDGTNALVPRSRLESKSHVLGAKFNRWKLEKISREHELQICEPVVFSSTKVGGTDLDSTERTLIIPDHAGYAFLIGDVERTG